jgi:hypothetical protein
VVEAAHELAYMNLQAAIDMPAARFGFAAMTSAEGDPVIAEAIAESYRGYLDPWKEVYAAFIEARGLRLRPGITVDDIANLLAALVDGIALRSIGNPSSDLVDHDRRRSLLGTAALALVQAFMERAEDADGMTLEDAVRVKINRRSPDAVDEAEAALPD